MLKFKFLTGDVNWKEYGGTFVSKRLNNGDFDYWMVIEVGRMPDDDQHYVMLCAVAPTEVPEKEWNSAKQSWGMADADMQNFLDRFGDLAKVEILASYGTKALVWQNTGTNLQVLLKEAHREADLCSIMFGYYMDRRQNAVGATGWDFLQGNVWGGLK